MMMIYPFNKNMKRKVTNVSYRKDSDSFPEWMKYEIEILNEDGTTEMIPAYGKDLQDALSRVVHDSKVEKITNTTKQIPDVVWVVLWFGYILGLIELTMISSSNPTHQGIIFGSGIIFISGAVAFAVRWFKKQNQDKNV